MKQAKPNQRGGGSSAGNEGHGAANLQQRQVLEALLDKLDAKAADDAKRQDRKNVRINFRRFSVPMHIHHPGGTTALRNVLTRDLSAGGLSFIHNGYIHVSTRIDTVLRRYVGGEDMIGGTVTHCQHIGGTWHIVGVKFANRIFPKLYIDPEQASSFTTDTIDPKTISGAVLHIEDQDLDRRLFGHHLRSTQIALTGCASIDEAKKAMADKSFDLVVVDLNLESAGGEGMQGDVIDAVRSTGYKGPISVCTAETRSDVLGTVQAKGIIGLLRKPYEADKLLAAISHWLQPQDSAFEPIYSTLAGQEEMRPLVEEYITNVKTLRTQLEEAMRRPDLQRTRAICMTLKGSGSGYGFAQVTASADEAISAIEQMQSVEKAVVPLQMLLDVCAQLSAEAPPDRSKAA